MFSTDRKHKTVYGGAIIDICYFSFSIFIFTEEFFFIDSKQDKLKTDEVPQYFSCSSSPPPSLFDSNRSISSQIRMSLHRFFYLMLEDCV